MTLLAFAFGAGMLSTVNPCGFAMLTGFFAYSMGDREPSGHGATSGLNRTPLARVGQGFRVGLAVSAGFAGMFVIVSVLVASGFRQVVDAVPWAAVIVGGGLLVAGLALAAGLKLALPGSLSLGTRSPGSGGTHAMMSFGAAYAVASLSCTLGLLLALVAQATAAGSMTTTAAVFIAYAAGAATILVGLAVAAALASATLARIVYRVLPVVDRLGGAALALSGAYLLAYWIPALSGGEPAAPIAAATSDTSAALTRLLDTNQTLVGVLSATLLIGGVAVAVTLGRRGVVGADHRQVDACTDCADTVNTKTGPASIELVQDKG